MFFHHDPQIMLQAYSKQLQDLLDSLIAGQPKVIGTRAELEQLEQEAKLNGAKSANRLIRKKAQDAALYWQRELGTGGGRPRTEPPLTERFRLGYEVSQVLPEVERCFAAKRQATYLRNQNLLKQKLQAKGCSKVFLDAVLSTRTPLMAACTYVSRGAPGSYVQSVARYYREFREYYDWVPSDQQIKKLAGKRIGSARGRFSDK